LRWLFSSPSLPISCSNDLVRVIDAHTHVFPASFIRDRVSMCDRDAWFDQLYRNPKALLVDAETLLESMDRAGIDRAVICGFPWRDAGICDDHNAYMADAVRRYPDRLSWIGIVTPGHEKRAAAVADDLLEEGACGLGEFNMDAQGFEFETPGTLDDAFAVCSAAGKPVMAHVSEPVGHLYPGKGTATPDRLLRLVERFPNLTIVAAHWGGGLPFYELMPEVREQIKNVVYDSAASTYLYSFAVFRTVIDIVGPEKVLFASDYPVLRQRGFLERVSSSAQWRTHAERDAVLAENAARIYGIGQNRTQT
jgi:uncharacterized protein